MPTEKRFVVDSMFGKLARWLRVLGFDTLCVHLKDREQLDDYARQGYQVITRNSRWASHPATVLVAANDAQAQLRELVAVSAITPAQTRRLSRCLRCNVCLVKVCRQQVAGHIPDYVYENRTSFYQCPQCQQFFWAGSHPSRMDDWLRATLGWSFLPDDQGGPP